jgi:hypothetical protein
MKPEELQIGVNYFGRVVTSLNILSENPSRKGLVFYTNPEGEELFDYLGAFCSWVTVQQGGEPTDPWHAYWHKREQEPPKRRGNRRIEVDGKHYRMRRGRLVEIPPEWVGKTTHPQTIRKRPSKRYRGRKFKRKVMR